MSDDPQAPANRPANTTKTADHELVAQAIRTICRPGQVVEVRALEATTGHGQWRENLTGYFDDPDKLAAAVCTIIKAEGIYFTPNIVKPELLARAANRIRRAKKGESTSDSQILRRTWLLIDVDVKRDAGISSTDAEHEMALAQARFIRDELTAEGWPQSILGDSGNGAHLLFPIDLPPDDGGLVKQCLLALAHRFDTENVQVDCSVFNPARIWKLYGTLAAKGDSTADRPHRMAKLLEVPENRVEVPIDKLNELAATAPKPEKPASPAKRRHSNSTFDIDAWIAQHLPQVGPPEPWQGGRRWVFDICPWNSEHTNGSAYIVQLQNGAIAAGCLHNSCQGNKWEQLRELFEPGYRDHRPATIAEDSTPSEGSLPLVSLPGGPASINQSATKLGGLMAQRNKYYLRGRTTVTVGQDDDGQPILETISPAALASVFESVAVLVKFVKKDGEPVPQQAICTEQVAKLIQQAEPFQKALPRIRLLSPCPVLIERNGALVQVSGYDQESGILAFGEPAPDVPLDEAVALLKELLAEFRFATQGDRARALAALITPELVFGKFLDGRAPVDLGEADKSQTGKGYRNKLTAAIYLSMVHTVTQKKGGVGSIEETFNAYLVRGVNFISLDNIRSSVDSPAIESFLTEDRYSARVPYQPSVEIDPRRIIVHLTSNKAEITPDLANRSSCVRILKQPEGYQFRHYHEGDLIDHVRANQALYLGAVFAVIRAWYAKGKPGTTDARHDFRSWARTLDWIVQNIFHAGPLLDGHRETQERMSNQGLNWLRDVTLAVRDAKRMSQWLRASALVDIIANQSGVEIPGLADGAYLNDPDVHKKVLQAMGRRLSQCFGNSDERIIANIRVQRNEFTDAEGRLAKEYLFEEVPGDGSPYGENAYSGRIGGNDPRIEGNDNPTNAEINPKPVGEGEEIPGDADSPLCARYAPPMRPPMETAVSPIPPMTSQQVLFGSQNARREGSSENTARQNIEVSGTHRGIGGTADNIPPTVTSDKVVEL